MKAAVVYDTKKPVVIDDLEIRAPGPGEVLVKIAACGVCRSDHSAARGTLQLPLPLVLGHEGAGVVEKVGERVTLVKPGDRVLLNWVPSCGTCYSCSSGRTYLCETVWSTFGVLQDKVRKGNQYFDLMSGVGCMAEYAVVDEKAAVEIPPEFPFDLASVVGCAVMTGVGAVINVAKVEPGASVAIFGAGGLGLNAINAASMVSADKIIAVDIHDWKLDYAKEFGATHTINALREDPVSRIKELTEGRGADYTFETAGTPKTHRQAYDAARIAGTVVMVGALGSGVEWTLPGLVGEEKTLKSTLFGSPVHPRVDLQRMLRLYLAGKLKLDKLVTKTYKLEQVEEAFKDMEEGKNARGVLVF